MNADTAMDLRHLPVWDRAALVLQRLEPLEVGQSFAFRMELNPRALVSHIQQQRPSSYAFDIVRQGIDDWRVIVLRVKLRQMSDSEAIFIRNAVLSRLSIEAREGLKRSIEEVTARKGAVLCSEDEPRDRLDIIADGVLGVFTGAEQRERLLFDLHAPDFSGDIELLDGGMSIGKNVVLSRSAQIFRIPYDALRPILEVEPGFLRALSSVAAQHVRGLSASLVQQTNHPILERIAMALLSYAAPERGIQPAFAPLAGMTQTQLAAAAGTVKEVAARAIAELEAQGALRRERGHVAYLDRAKLLAIIDRG